MLAVRRGTQLAEQVFALLLLVLSRGLPGRARVTSYKGGVHTPGSQHPLGTAIDLGVRTAEERAAAYELLRRWRAVGLTGLDEGDHVHLQLFQADQSVLNI